MKGIEIVAFGTEGFDSAFYREQNPDVAAAGIDPLVHYMQFGLAEGRQPNAADRLVEVTVTDTDLEGPAVDDTFYLADNPDVAEAVESGVLSSASAHFQAFGNAEGRSPNALFDTEVYLANNPDVAAAVDDGQLTAWDHFDTYGWREGRNPSDWFATPLYLEDNPDVAAADINPLVHFLEYGAEEGRLAQYIGDVFWA